MSTGPKNPSVPGSARSDDARPCRVDRLAREADLRVRITVVLQNLDGTLARSLLDLVGQRRRRREAADRREAPRAHPAGRTSNPSSRTSSTVTGLSGTSFRRDAVRQRNEKGGSKYQDPPHVLYSFSFFVFRSSFFVSATS